jgi:hypothetical protein
MRPNLTLALLCLLLSLATPLAWACKPKMQNLLTEYSGEVFLGKALSVRDEGAGGNAQQERPIKIRFKVLHWLREGTAKDTVEVNGVVNSMAGTDCWGQFDFSAKVGEIHIVFGQFGKDGSFRPDHFIYIKEEDKYKIPGWLYRAYFLNQYDD